jgi:hypothetical protein
MYLADSLEEAHKFFRVNCRESVLCRFNGEERECDCFPDAKSFFEDKIGAFIAAHYRNSDDPLRSMASICAEIHVSDMEPDEILIALAAHCVGNARKAQVSLESFALQHPSETAMNLVRTWHTLQGRPDLALTSQDTVETVREACKKCAQHAQWSDGLIERIMEELEEHDDMPRTMKVVLKYFNVL